MLSHSPYIQGDSVHPLIQIFVLEPTGCMKADILHKAIHLLCQRAVLVGGTVQIADCLHLFKDAIPSVSSWLRTFFVPCRWPRLLSSVAKNGGLRPILDQ